MPGKHLYEYAVIRIVPRMDREEFQNIGVIVFSKQSRFLDCRYIIWESRLNAFGEGRVDVGELTASLEALKRICAGAKGSGTIGCLDAASRFRWLTATRSTIIQTSKVHPGFCDDLPAELDKLFEDLVML